MGAVTWRSKKQKIAATSSSEAEYIASCLETKEAVWLSRLIADVLGIATPKPILIKVDNAGAIDTARNSFINEHNKHVDLKYRYVRNCVSTKRVLLEHCPTFDQAADPSTKPLDRVKHKRLIKIMRIGTPSFEGEC